MIFINLPTNDVKAAKAFFGELGFGCDPRISDENCAGVVARRTSR